MNFKFALAFMLAACVSCTKVATVEIENPSSKAYVNEAVPIDARQVADKIGQADWTVVDEDGNFVPSQITSDSLLLILANIEPKGKAHYHISPLKTPTADTIATGKVRHDRLDDMAWENDKGGYRAYGPPLQATGEKGYGYDIFTKRDTDKPILDALYAGQQKGTSYHIDHGHGMDCFAVGPTLGAGCTALVIADTLRYPWCWDQQRILDNGPLRFRVTLAFTPATIGEDSNGEKYTEVRDITLDAGKYLNHTKVSYQGLMSPQMLVAGFPLRDDGAVALDDDNRYFAYVNPTLNLYPDSVTDQGKIFQGIVLTQAPDSISSRLDGDKIHLVAYDQYLPGNEYDYYWGFAWDKAGIDWSQWLEYLNQEADALTNPLIINVK